MKNKLVGLIRNKPIFTFAIAAIVLVAAVGIAALLGAFGSKDTKDASSSSDTTIGRDGTVNFADATVKITALESDSLGVNPTSAFKLAFGKAPDEKELAASLSVKPDQAFRLKKVSGSEYSMEFEKPLDKDSIYRFILSDKTTGAEQSWAFQTKKSLNVIRTLPRDKSVQVPSNSGIEITFSHENIENAEKYFEISPKTGGRFELHKRTLVFIPDKLDAFTIYTVTIKSGIGVKGSNDTLENDYTFSFQTEVPGSNTYSRSYFAFSDVMYSFTPQAAPALQVYADENMVDKEVAVELYSYPDTDSFLKDLKSLNTKPSWAVSQSTDSPYDESKLEKASSVNARIISNQNVYWYTTYLLLPSSLPEGYYLAKMEIDEKKYYTQFQVNAASVYILTTKDKSLAWLNNSTTGKPLSGAEVMLDGGVPVKADQDGMAVLNEILSSASDVSSFYFLVKPSGGLPFIALVRSNLYQPYYGYYYNSDTINNYWTYIYLDKGIYLPDDTVNVWGVIKPRDGSSSETEAVVELIRYDYSISGNDNASVLTSGKVKISPNGTFTGSLRLSNYNPGSYEVRVKVGDRTLLTNYLQIMDYTKPAYKLDVIPDRSFMYAWDKVNFDIQAAFYEGTPVSGIKLDYSSNIAGSTLNSGSLVSDAAGASSLTVNPMTPEAGWRPLTLSMSISNKEAEEQQINEYSYVTVFPKDTMIEITANTEGEVGSATITTSRIDLERLKGKSSGYYTEDEYRGSSLDMPLTAKLYEKHYEKKITGDYYDYINKVKRDTYEYYEVQNLVEEYSFNTANGEYELEYTVVKDKNYYLEVYGKDSEGRAITEAKYLYNWNYYTPYNNRTYYITDSSLNKQYKIDEKVSVEVKYNKEEPNEGSNRKYLFIRMKNGVLDFNVTANPIYNFNFNKYLIPNMYVKAVCFDGSNIYDAGLQQYTYDRGEKQLDIKVKADKESYKPGDTVKLSFDVKDAQGRACSSEINVSIVDEAYFAIAQQYVDTLFGLYGPTVSSGIISDYLSFRPVDETGNPMAEGGEGGDMYVRKDFKDSALFTSVISGNNGKAEASFKLPDNLTSWRVTYQAVTGDLKAGNGKVNISSKLPFFVDTVFNKAFITGDSPSILIRAYGTELPGTAEVDYKVIVTDANGTLKTHNAKGKASTMSEIPLGNLLAGNYTIRVEAVSGSLKDAIERSFKVSDSLLEIARTDYISLTDKTAMSNNAKGLTSLVFYGEDSSLLYNELQSLYWNWGQRLDQKLARKVAGELLQKRFNEQISSDEEFDIKKYQTEDGGLALLTYDSSNPALSAKMCSLAVDSIDREALASYFRKLLEDSKTMPEDTAYAYWGLAALKEPVLLDIRSLLAVGNITPHIKLILGAALAEIGDFQGARDIYKEAMEKAGKVTDTFAYLETATRDESIDATALCSLIALKINAPEKIKLFNYMKSNSTSELLVNLERMIFVTNYIKDASLDSSFSYELDGSKKHVDLQKGSYYRLTLTPEKLAALMFTNVQGKVIVAASYVVPVSKHRLTGGSPVSVERTYSVGKGSTTSFNRSDTVKITLTPGFSENAPDGYYEITDILPAGFRFFSASSSYGNTSWYLDEVTGQKVVFGYYYSKTKGSKGSIDYYARAVTPGTYTADNAAIRHTGSDVTAFAGKAQVSIGK